jgi:hypothetical protein
VKIKHTPAPWQFALAYSNDEARPPYSVWVIVGNTDANERKHSTVATTITNDADARLIAAAPELLAALVELKKELWAAGLKLNVRKHFSLLAADAQAGTAIDKATGGQP